MRYQQGGHVSTQRRTSQGGLRMKAARENEQAKHRHARRERRKSRTATDDGSESTAVVIPEGVDLAFLSTSLFSAGRAYGHSDPGSEAD